MSLVEINWNPEKGQLRLFGLAAIIVLGVVAVILRFVLGVSGIAAVFVAGAGLFIFIVSLISFKAARIIYLGLTFAGLPVGIVISFLLMAAFYFFILTPVGLVFKLIGRDALARKFRTDAPTYWTSHTQSSDPARYFHQF
ncbi:MAG: hypothetical protein ABII09_04325 [Planctomycetota bacterium]